jgi:hypothetical protein
LEIFNLVLDHFQGVLRDIQSDAERYEYKMGRPPMSFVVEQCRPSSHARFNTGIPIRRWNVTASLITPMKIDEEFPLQSRYGMYYDYGKADFAIFEDTPRVRIGWQVGPLFGRGYDLPLELAEDSHARFGVPIPLWVS